jgi:hypothetical protein
MRILSIIAIIFGVLLLVSFGFYGYFISYSSKGSVQVNCAYAGRPLSNPDFGNYNACCGNLKAISGSNIDQFEDSNCDLSTEEFGLICSDCGNGNCEPWEHKCNCPEDCN